MPLVSKTFSEIITFTRASTATYFNAAGTLTSAAINAPRFDYNPATFAAQGMLIEEQRVNLLVYSNNLENSAWTKTNATVTANVTTSPDGNVNSEAVIEDTATTVFHTLTGAAVISGVSGAAYTLSIFAKPAGRTKFLLQIDTPGFGNGNCIFDVASGATGAPAGTASAPKITPVGNGWYRCSVLMTATGSFTSVDLKVILLNASDQQQYTGDGVSGIYLYGAQIEAGSFATSYAPSVNTFTSRASTGSYFDSAGVLQSAAINVARNTYNPANLLAQPFLLLEEARTNSIRNNTMVGAVAGTPGTAPTNWVVVPSGTAVITIVGTGVENGITYIEFQIVETTAAASSILFESTTQVVAADTQIWTNSFYIKKISGSASTTYANRIVYRTVAGAAVTALETLYTTSSAALNTQRSITSFTASGGTIARVTGQFAVTTTGADTAVFRIGLPQLEQGAFATSVIPTSTVALTRAADLSSSAQATRAADVASVNTLSPWYNASEGTLYAELSLISSSLATGVAADIGAGGAFGTTEYITWNGTQWLLQPNAAPVNVNSIVTTTSTAKVAAAMQANNSVISANGLIGTVDTACAIAASPTTLTIGRGGWSGSANYINGYLRRITYYPRRLSNAELQTLTT